jgi:hypothetical protein
MSHREPYVKPVISQLHYSTEPGVAIASPCKTSGSSTGPTIEACKTTNIFTPCVTLES